MKHGTFALHRITYEIGCRKTVRRVRHHFRCHCHLLQHHCWEKLPRERMSVNTHTQQWTLGRLQYLTLLEVLHELERALNLRHLDLHRLLCLVHVRLHQLVLALDDKNRTGEEHKRAQTAAACRACVRGITGEHYAPVDPLAIGHLWSMIALSDAILSNTLTQTAQYTDSLRVFVESRWRQKQGVMARARTPRGLLPSKRSKRSSSIATFYRFPPSHL